MSTLTFYQNNAIEYAAETANVDFTATQERFLKYLPIGSHILDFGCGSGRDSKCFFERGYAVTATDGCKEFVALASSYTGLEVKELLFNDLDAENVYDGVWACASILHLPKEELKDVLCKICRALKNGGYFYTSFKYGSFEGEVNGRYFTYLDEDAFAELLAAVPELKAIEQWVSGDVRTGRGAEMWLNVIMQKA